MGRVLVLFDSDTGCTAKMAEYVAAGARSVVNTEVRLLSVDQATAQDVIWADGLAVGTPTNLGSISWKMKKWWDDFSADHWNRVDGRLCCTFSSQGGHAGGGELACMTMAHVLLNFGFLFFGVTDYVSSVNTLHYGSVVAKEPRHDSDRDACQRLGLRLAEWVAVLFDGNHSQHPLLTTKVDTKANAPTMSMITHTRRRTNPNSVHLLVRKTVAPDKQDEWLRMAAELSAHSWNEAGCMAYTFTRMQDSDSKFVIIEEWESKAAFESHTQSKHFKHYVPLMDAISTTDAVEFCSKAIAGDSFLTGFCPSTAVVPAHAIRPSVLIYTRATDYVHGSTPAAAVCLSNICHSMGWSVVVSDNPDKLQRTNAKDLSPKYDLIVLVNNSGAIFDTKTEVLSEHVKQGRGVLGVHAALACFLDGQDSVGGTPMKATWPFIEELFGAHFKNHPPPQEGTVHVNQQYAQKYPTLKELPETFQHFDEFFNFSGNPAEIEDVEILATVDEKTYEGGSMGSNCVHPIVWCRHWGENRAPIFYCALGHFTDEYNEGASGRVKSFLRLGIEFCMKRNQ